MKIDQLQLENFKCHKEIELSFTELTILTGANASGKSSVIQSILIAEKSFEEVEKKAVQVNDINGINLGLPINIISNEPKSNTINICIEIENFKNEVQLELFDQEENPLSFKICNLEEILLSKEKCSGLNNLNLQYINAERIGPRISSLICENLDLYVGSRGENTNYVISKVDLLQKKLQKYKLPEPIKISTIDRFSANCEEWLNIVIPDTKFNLHTEPELNISTIKYNNGENYYAPTATGFGITYVLPIIVQALVATMNNNSVLIVENPEAHLHPYSQSTIGKFLALVSTCGVQVIIETHSEHVINGCRLQLAKMKKTSHMSVDFFENSNSYHNISINELGELEKWPNGFFDQAKKDLRELLELRLCKK